MYSKVFVSFFQLILIFSILIFFTENAGCQIGLAKSGISLKVSLGEDDKAVNSIRPRVYKDKGASNEKVVEKAITNFEFERTTFDEINIKRAAVGLKPLIWSDDAAKIARIHSENMANFKFFSHEGLDGSMVNDRADSFGVSKWRAIAENIAYNRGIANPVEFVVESWMKSTGHRENILNDRWKESGIGIAITGDGTHYFTQVFMQRK